MNPIIQISLDLRRLHCTQPCPRSRRTMSAEANAKRRVTNVSGGTKFSPSFITGTLVPNNSPAKHCCREPSSVNHSRVPGKQSLIDLGRARVHNPYLILFLVQ